MTSFYKMNFTAGIITLFTIFTPSIAIECYRCTSNNTLDCLEKFMQPNPLKPESCADVFEARYCIKTTGIYNGVVGTQRFCHDRDLGNFCEFITHEGDQREYKGCVYTCNSDGCNAATTNFQLPTFRNIVALAATLLLICRLL